MSADSRATVLLRRLKDGDEQVSEELLRLLYSELHSLAERQMRDQPGGHTLQPTALVHEAWIRLVGLADGDGWNRARFFTLAARAMRSVLVDHARRKGSQKRGGDRHRFTLDDLVLRAEERGVDLLALDEALGDLARVDESAAEIVELRFFGGLSNEEVAQARSVSTRTIERGWKMARVFLHDRLAGESA
ncbi:MAG: ECF-type sigma factor [Planctomycetota bacterium]